MTIQSSANNEVWRSRRMSGRAMISVPDVSDARRAPMLVTREDDPAVAVGGLAGGVVVDGAVVRRWRWAARTSGLQVRRRRARDHRVATFTLT